MPSLDRLVTQGSNNIPVLGVLIIQYIQTKTPPTDFKMSGYRIFSLHVPPTRNHDRLSVDIAEQRTRNR